VIHLLSPRRTKRVVLVALSALVTTTAGIAADEASVTHLVPSGGQQGKTVEVVLRGTLNGGDKRKAWSSHPGIVVTFAKKNDRVQVAIKGDVPPGRYFLRFSNTGAASSLLPFIVSPIGEVNELEPNGKLPEAQKLAGVARVINGVLSESRDVDVFEVAMKSGQTLVASMMANTELGSPMDGLLQVVSEKGFVVAQNDDSLGLDPFVTFTAPGDGRFFVRTFAFPAKTNSTIGLASGSDFVYRLTVTTGSYVDFTVPSAFSKKKPGRLAVKGWNLPKEHREWLIDPMAHGVDGRFYRQGWNNTVRLKAVTHDVATELEPNGRKKPQRVSVPTTLTGTIGNDKDRDVFEIEAKKGSALEIAVESRRLGFPLDPVIRVSDGTGKVLKETDTRSADKVDEAISWSPPKNGTFRVEVRDLFEHGGPRFVYRLTIQPQPVTVSATVGKDVLTLDGDKPLEVKVTINRSGGFDKAVRIELENPFEGVVAKPVTSEAKGPTAKTVTLKLQRKEGVQDVQGGPLRIVGRVEGMADPVAIVTAPVPRLTERAGNLWLIVKPMSKPKKK
tara:strand:- start:120 stop:1796 length:1677 start_codon:yes stop_codon:yes gene_type:complete